MHMICEPSLITAEPCDSDKHHWGLRSSELFSQSSNIRITKNEIDTTVGVMEVLGIAASVIAVVQLTGACLKLSKKWLGPSEFSTSELNVMMADLYVFNGVLKSFQTHLEVHSDDETRILGLNHLTPVLHRCEEALKRIRDFMEESGVIGRHLLAPRFDRKLKLSLQILERAKGLLELAVSADLR